MGVTLDQLRYFHEAARYEHLGRAAKGLHISRSAVSHAIAALEAELGSALFERRGKNVQVTDEGRRLNERVSRILDDVDALRSDLTGDAPFDRGHYRFAATHVACGALLVPAWHGLAARYPRATSDLHAYRSGEVVARVLDGDLDAGVCFSPVPHPDLAIDVLTTGRLALLVSTEHPLVGAEANVVMARLASYPCVMPKALPGVDVCELHPVLTAHGLACAPVARYDSIEVGAALLGDGASWTLAPEIVTRWCPEVVVLALPSTWSAEYTLAAVSRRATRRTPLVTEWLAEVARLARPGRRRGTERRR